MGPGNTYLMNLAINPFSVYIRFDGNVFQLPHDKITKIVTIKNTVAYLSGIPHNTKIRFSFVYTEEYESWFISQPPKIQAQIEKRLSRIKNDGHFGSVKNLGNGLAELKFTGLRACWHFRSTSSFGVYRSLF